MNDNDQNKIDHGFPPEHIYNRMTEEQKRKYDSISVLTAAVLSYGSFAQTDVAIEEMAELTQALIHNRRGRPANIAEEIADVEIMLEQLKIIHRCEEEVRRIKDAKIRRLAFQLRQQQKEK